MSVPLNVENDDGVRTLTLARPDSHNALNRDLLDALTTELRDAHGDVAAVVIRGNEDAFSAGIDLEEAGLGSGGGGTPELLASLQRTSRALAAFDGLSVAALTGHVVGAGFELACGCDVRVADASATFRLPELELGITLTNGATATLPALVGPGEAKRLVVDGGPFDAEELTDRGLIERFVDDAHAEADTLARRATDCHREALVRTLLAFDADRSLEAALDAETRDVLELVFG